MGGIAFAALLYFDVFGNLLFRYLFEPARLMFMPSTTTVVARRDGVSRRRRRGRAFAAILAYSFSSFLPLRTFLAFFSLSSIGVVRISWLMMLLAGCFQFAIESIIDSELL